MQIIYGDKKGTTKATHKPNAANELNMNIILSGKESFLMFLFIFFLDQRVNLFRIDSMSRSLICLFYLGTASTFSWLFFRTVVVFLRFDL